MSYQPLHHKYRPKSFAELVGQEAIATTLINAIRSSKIAPAYLFTGPRGTGKTSSARILAKSLNCLQNDLPTAEPCGICDVCQGITKGYTLDVIEIDAASNTGVDNIREIIEKAQFAPVQCRYKVYVIDECHMLSTQAFNALLKTLEEPPRHVVFVLATTDPQRVLPTIISRCQRFDFRRINLEAMVKHLSAIAGIENIHISPEAVTLIAQISQGGLRDAESLLDQLALLSGEVTPERVWDLVGVVSEQDLLTLLGAITQNQAEAVLDCTRKILDRGREPLTILQNLAAFYRDLLIAKTAPNRQDLVACTQQTWKGLLEFTQRLDISHILAGQQHLRTAEVQIKNTTQPRLWLEVTLLGLLPSATFQPQITAVSPRVSTPAISPTYPPVSDSPTTSGASATPTLLPRNGTAPLSTSPPPVTPSIPQPSTEQTPLNQPVQPETPVSPPQEVNGATQTDFTQVWQQVLENIQQIPRRALLGQMCHLIEFDGNVARVRIQPAWYEKVKSDLPTITAAFQQTFQRPVNVSLEKGTSSISTSAKKNPPVNGSPTVQQPPPKNYDIQPPAPAPPPTTPAPTKTESAKSNSNSGGVQTLPPPPAKKPPSNWETDEVAIAAQRLAQFFDGQIIRVIDDVGEFSNSVNTSELLDDSEYDDEY